MTFSSLTTGNLNLVVLYTVNILLEKQDSEISDTVSIASKKWNESLSKPNLDYADIFSEEVSSHLFYLFFKFQVIENE